MSKRERDAWRRRMAECDHRKVEIQDIDGREYGICQECLWLMPGRVARTKQRDEKLHAIL